MLTRSDLENKVLLVSGYPHTIGFMPNLHLDGEELEGEIDHSLLTITLDAKLPQPLYLAVVLHEVYHAMERMAGNGPNYDEKSATLFGYFMSNFLYDNSWLLDAILASIQYRRSQ